MAFSGGGDSTAIVHALKDHPQAKYVYIVDHDLRAGSGAEAEAARVFAGHYGYTAKVLTWNHNSPQSGLQEKARQARYKLMGEQCRAEGIKYLLTAHNEADQAETLLMRYERKTDWRGAAGIAELTYAPIWPALAMVNVVRPLLDCTRQELRDYNRAQGLSWAEDPSNQNRNFARIRARDELSETSIQRRELLATARDMRSALREEQMILQADAKAKLRIDEMGLIHLSAKPLPELMFHCLRAASGLGQHIDRAKIKRLLGMMDRAAFKSATLGGALIAKQKSGFVISRDPVAVIGRRDTRLGVSAASLNLDSEFKIWDGRWAVKTHLEDTSIAPRYSLDDPRDSRAPAHKITQPVLRHYSTSKEDYKIFDSMKVEGVEAICLVQKRLDAALGLKTPLNCTAYVKYT